MFCHELSNMVAPTLLNACKAINFFREFISNVATSFLLIVGCGPLHFHPSSSYAYTLHSPPSQKEFSKGGSHFPFALQGRKFMWMVWYGRGIHFENVAAHLLLTKNRELTCKWSFLFSIQYM
ncbi:hypothetical protein VIGAN_09154500 [Vigna angularis var. angularis]|uniref:Uncharacterized protein n=1 Tax=Vigna angularis var. angularis TaxID=157739 RepID=A0A0S3SYU3_PHAAN|nr:hypothetical protein VIGAN_09154500 [Vigna angularis var. angularis]